MYTIIIKLFADLSSKLTMISNVPSRFNLNNNIWMALTVCMYTPQNNQRTSLYVFPLFNTVSYTFKIKNIICVQGPFETISRKDEQQVYINSFQKANRDNKIRPKYLEKFENI